MPNQIVDHNTEFKSLWLYWCGHTYEGTITITEAGAVVTARNEDKTNKNFVSFTDYISKINKTQVDNAKSLDVLMLMYILIEYRNNYMKTSYIWLIGKEIQLWSGQQIVSLSIQHAQRHLKLLREGCVSL